MAVTGARRVFFEVAAGESVGRSFSLSFRRADKQDPCGEQLAEVGPIFIRSYISCSRLSLTGLSSQPLWVRA